MEAFYYFSGYYFFSFGIVYVSFDECYNYPMGWNNGRDIFICQSMNAKFTHINDIYIFLLSQFIHIWNINPCLIWCQNKNSIMFAISKNSSCSCCLTISSTIVASISYIFPKRNGKNTIFLFHFSCIICQSEQLAAHAQSCKNDYYFFLYSFVDT